MSAFKDCLAKDLRRVFLNTNEFATVHHLGPDALPIACNLNKDVTAAASGDQVGVFTNTMTIYVAFEDLPDAPVEGELFRVDGSLHLVKSVNIEANGMLVIVCEANES